MELSAIALRGLEQAQQRLETSAIRLSSGTASELPIDVVDLSADIVSMLSAKTEFSANVRVLETAGEMEKQLINLLA